MGRGGEGDIQAITKKALTGGSGSGKSDESGLERGKGGGGEGRGGNLQHSK